MVGFAAAVFVTGRSAGRASWPIRRLTAELNELISDPLFVQTVRFGVMNVDEIVAGAAGYRRRSWRC